MNPNEQAKNEDKEMTEGFKKKNTELKWKMKETQQGHEVLCVKVSWLKQQHRRTTTVVRRSMSEHFPAQVWCSESGF